MKEYWKSDQKYAENGVNGSLCSILVYLSEVSYKLSWIREGNYNLNIVSFQNNDIDNDNDNDNDDDNGSHTGLKVNDQPVAYATRFLAVRLKNYVWSLHRALKAKVQCNFSSAYSPEHSNILRLRNIKSKHRYNTTRHPKNKAALFF